MLAVAADLTVAILVVDKTSKENSVIWFVLKLKLGLTGVTELTNGDSLHSFSGKP